jgi:SynChlorMet cassette protein ScmC
MWLALYPIYQSVQEAGGLPLHAALVSREGIGVLLAAPAGSGKSTCCSRLPAPWETLCDDETLIVRDEQNHYLAHPFPTWSDYIFRTSERTWNVQDSVPLPVVFFLEQAPTDEVIPMGEGQAAVRFNQLATEVCWRHWHRFDCKRQRRLKQRLFHNASEFAKAIPAYRLRASLNGRFWEQMERVLF